MNASIEVSAPAVEIVCADALAYLDYVPSGTFDCCVTSPPYWGLRDYNVEGQIGLEETMTDYVEKIVEVCRAIRRVLRDDGTFWLNLGDCYANDGKWGGETGGKQAYLDDSSRKRNGREKRHTGLKPKNLCMIPARVALALQADGWRIRSEIVWRKPNPMPESVRDRPTSSHEKIYLLTKRGSGYFYDADAIKTPLSPKTLTVRTAPRKGTGVAWMMEAHGGRKHPESANARNTWLDAEEDLWSISSRPFRGAHFATFPEKLVERCLLAGCRPGGRVLDPFGGSGTTAVAARRLGRRATLIELNPEYCEIARRRLAG